MHGGSRVVLWLLLAFGALHPSVILVYDLNTRLFAMKIRTFFLFFICFVLFVAVV